ncbi:MAG: DUF1707 domain-containing protein [Streptosporangiaceae bacterium]
MITGPEEGAAAGRGALRASHADREQVIDTLKTAFADGRLDKDELDARVGQALAARTCAELTMVSGRPPGPWQPSVTAAQDLSPLPPAPAPPGPALACGSTGPAGTGLRPCGNGPPVLAPGPRRAWREPRDRRWHGQRRPTGTG